MRRRSGAASLHDGFIPGTALADGGPATPFTPAPKAPSAAAAAPAAAGATAAGAAAAGAAVSPAPENTLGVPSAAGNAATNAPASAPSPQQAGAAGAPNPRAAAQGSTTTPPATGGLEIIFRPDPTVWDGRFANNGWLQELPKPLTKVTWDPTAWVSPQLAKERGLNDGDLIELKYRGNTMRLPVFRVPGHPAQSVTVFLGYGRRMAGRVGTAAKDAEAFNAYLLRTSDAPWFGDGLEISKTGSRYLLATTQEHHMMEGREPVRVATLEQYKAEPHIIAEHGEKPPNTLTLYPDHVYDGNKWGMAIDLTTCTGCSACTIACVAENNIPVVGKEQVAARTRDALDSRRSLLRRQRLRHRGRGVPSAGTLHAVRERAVRGRLPGRRHVTQRRRPERHGLQPLRRHALLLEQLPVQGAAVQLPALPGLDDAEPRADAQPRRHGAQPRRHGEVHLLRAAHQPGPDRRQA